VGRERAWASSTVVSVGVWGPGVFAPPIHPLHLVFWVGSQRGRCGLGGGGRGEQLCQCPSRALHRLKSESESLLFRRGRQGNPAVLSNRMNREHRQLNTAPAFQIGMPCPSFKFGNSPQAVDTTHKKHRPTSPYPPRVLHFTSQSGNCLWEATPCAPLPSLPSAPLNPLSSRATASLWQVPAASGSLRRDSVPARP
jgi:hypothetical protein